MRRSEQKEKRREEILLSGLDIFIRKGYTAAKIQDIAQMAGISVGLMFHYFQSKEKLYEELILLGISGPQTLLNSIQADSLTFFEIAAREIFKLLTTDLFVTKMFVLMTQARHNDAAPESVKALLADTDFTTISTEKIKQGQQNGTIKDGNPVSLAIAFWGAVSGIAEEIALMPGAPVPDSDWVVDILRRRMGS